VALFIKDVSDAYRLDDEMTDSARWHRLTYATTGVQNQGRGRPDIANPARGYWRALETGYIRRAELVVESSSP
jgi:hypothetical protein